MLPLLLVCALAAQSTGEFAPPPNPNAPVPLKKVPQDVILVKGAVASASDASTPLPEGGAISHGLYRNSYFGLSYSLPADWQQKYDGPPPSSSGSYVLAQVRPDPANKRRAKATLLITAHDRFFTLVPGNNAMETIKASSESLMADYKVEHPPVEVTLANRPFVRFGYVSPSAQLHWTVLATEVRCHLVRFIFTSGNAELIESLAADLNKMTLAPADAPQCVAHYAEGKNVTYRVEPAFTERRFNSVPVRLIIGTTGKVRHVHVINGFPEQSRAITDALLQWRFKPYLKDGKPVEVETGIVFGARPLGPRATGMAAGGD
jgi:hypothetical protein